MRRSHIATIIILAGWLQSSPASAGSSSPVFVELFTAQGCASCPPADAILAKLAKRSDMVVLAFHVNYWDSTGWTDHLAIPASMARQRVYQATFHKRGVYTPQMIIDGVIEIPGNNPNTVLDAVDSAREKRGESLMLSLTRQDANTLAVAIDASPTLNDAEVWLATFDPNSTVEVKRGENRGHTILNVNIVRDIRTIGHYSGHPWTSNIPVDAIKATQGIAVWIQPAGKSLGPVAVAAVLPPLKTD